METNESACKYFEMESNTFSNAMLIKTYTLKKGIENSTKEKKNDIEFSALQN